MLLFTTRPRACGRSLSIIAFSLGTIVSVVPRPTHATPITLQAATERALAENPDLGRATSDIGIGEGRLVTARTRPFNPEVGVSAGPVRVGGTTVVDYEVSLGQVFELGGKRSRRVAVAEADLAATRARKDWTRREVVLRVRRAYYLATLDRARVATARDALAAADEARAAMLERLRQKAGTQLEVNVATADAGRAKRALLDAERSYTTARAVLGATIGAQPAENLEPADEAPPPPELVVTEDALVGAAMSTRADLRAARFDRDAAAAGVSLSDAGAVPDLGVNLRYSREKDPDFTFDVFAIGISVPLPIFDRKQGDRLAARSTLRKADIEEKAVRWQAERDIRSAYRTYQAAREAVRAFDLDVVGKLNENLTLARESFQAGKIGLVEFNVVRRDLVETRFAYLDAWREAVEALIALELAAGEMEVVR